MNPFPAITISRSIGSEGAQIGFLTARRLGWRFCDRRILREAARNLGLSVESLRGQEERPCGFLQQLLNLTAFASPEVPFVPPFETPIYSSELFDAERTVMRRFADAAPSVIIGRGGFAALKGRPNTLHVRVHASLGRRIQRLLDEGRFGDEKAVRRMVLDSDRARAEFFRKVLGLDWNDLKPFDLVIDTDETDPASAVDILVAQARERLDLGQQPH